MWKVHSNFCRLYHCHARVKANDTVQVFKVNPKRKSRKVRASLDNTNSVKIYFKEETKRRRKARPRTEIERLMRETRKRERERERQRVGIGLEKRRERM